MRKTLSTGLIGLLCLSLLPSLAFAWSREKPSNATVLDERVDTAKLSSDGNAAVGLGVSLYTYLVGDGRYDYNDWLDLRMVVTANTRENLNYQPPTSSLYNWVDLNDWDYTELTGDGDDDWIEWINLENIPGMFPQPFLRFYGAPDSGEYYSIGVSSNGFVTFNETATEDKYYSRSIPDPEGPNGFAAPFWTDLRPTEGGSIKIGKASYIGDGFYLDSLVVTWEGVPDKYGVPQTFQLGIADAWNFWPSPIWFQYKDVTFNDAVTIGIESEHGSKGFEIEPGTINDRTAILFREYDVNDPDHQYAFITALKITIVRNDAISSIYILENPALIRGSNVQLTSEEPDTTAQFAFALFGDATLLICGALLPTGAGLILGAIPIGYSLVTFAAEQMAPAEPEAKIDGTDLNYARILVKERPPCPAYAPATYTDALFGINVDWVMPDAAQESSIDISATLEYFTCAPSGGGRVDKTVTTDVITLTFLPANRPPDSPSRPSGSTYNYLGESKLYSTSATDPDGEYGDRVKYKFNWGDGSTTTTGYYDPGVMVTRSHLWSMLGTYYVKVQAEDENGGLLSGWSESLCVHVYDPGGGDGCPTLSVWNGTEYMDYGVVDIHNSTGDDVVRDVFVSLQDVSVYNYKAKFRLTEGWEGLNFSESIIDQVKLYAVDCNGRYHLCPLIKAQYSSLGSVVFKLMFSDDWKAQMLLLETIDLQFLVLYEDIQNFIFTIEGCNQFKY